ncbi:MAG: polyprenyl synthetase family protein [Kiritimatiellae bacterium]|nr:polyprenyl synthetase family protein [Kiritimatiellia bacterium]
MNLEKAKEEIEMKLAALLPSAEGEASALHAAMRWAVECGGKRIRPLLCLAAAEAVGGAPADALMPACAIELLHSYTLVHDDLPAMDNDTERRGRPSVWAKFGEATAILAGDALQSLAFAVLSQGSERCPGIRAALVSILGEAAVDVVRGQAAELAGCKDIDYVYRHKTADLFLAAAALGATAGGGTAAQVERMRDFARHLGLAFQHEDDLLDGDSPLGRAEAGRRVREHTRSALAALDGLPGDTAFLSSLATRLATRTA